MLSSLVFTYAVSFTMTASAASFAQVLFGDGFGASPFGGNTSAHHA